MNESKGDRPLSQSPPPGLEVRYTEPGDAKYLKQWFMEPSTIRWFPMEDEIEIDDAVMRWIAFYRYKCSLTILKDGVPCGIATLYLQPYRTLAHQCEFGIIVGENYRKMGIGTYLMNSIMHLAKEKFKIELIHLQTYAENPAIKLYKRFGFKEFGRQNAWIKEKDGYFGRVFMERSL
jgi:putative acetyltransferase